MAEASPQLDPDSLNLLRQALQAQAQGELTRARDAYLRVLERCPDQVDACCNVGAVFRQLGDLERALVFGRRAVALHPESVASLINLADSLGATGDLEGALVHLRRAQGLAPQEPLVYSHLADLHHRLDDDEAALAFHRAALELAPDHPELRLNLGYGLMRQGHLDEAVHVLAHAVAQIPAHPRARWVLAYARLLQGRWHEAWPFFRARLDLPEAAENRRVFPQPLWDGSPFPGRTLLVWGEQGFGDTVMAARLLPRVKALGGQVVVSTYGPLLPVLEAQIGVDDWHQEGTPVPEADLQIPLMDLPALLDLRPQDLDGAPFLAPPPESSVPDALREALESASARRIGLVWRGHLRHTEDRHRSVDLRRLARLADLPDLTWFSLQVPGGGLPFPGITDLSPFLRHFGDTAWALSRLDAVVTVDTAVAHLAGALGVRTHLLLPFFPDWRWGFAGDRTPWYASVRLHRQRRPGDWNGPLQEILEALA